MTWIGGVEHIARGRKAHVCSWCGEGIEVGKPSVRWIYKDGSEVLAVRMHPECQSAMHEMHSIDPYFDEWDLHSFSRGCTCERGACECDKAKRAPEPAEVRT